eukprot:CAMPEP_0170565502 /NCGR_PEP_ID=MMETSP0211-20121228/79229_1 /TAXON_ID=311385 /ORGANISM="Pseudokeronopsis sp., Strain OXSARD2" /LENGTH=64 /DNA_ID=CAMNT_0010886389 /DNA_START=290 /DNA_END=484 /DNA_ORIENTATION=+
MEVAVQPEPNKEVDGNKMDQVLKDHDLLTLFRRYVLTLNTFSEVTLNQFDIPGEVSEQAQLYFI